MVLSRSSSAQVPGCPLTATNCAFPPPEFVAGSYDEYGPAFGAALAAGDFDGDRADDLAVGAPQVGLRAGVVVAMYGGDAGLSFTGAQRWSQDSAGVPGSSRRGNRFGYSLSSADFGRWVAMTWRSACPRRMLAAKMPAV